jgi:hypothetical protein
MLGCEFADDEAFALLTHALGLQESSHDGASDSAEGRTSQGLRSAYFKLAVTGLAILTGLFACYFVPGSGPIAECLAASSLAIALVASWQFWRESSKPGTAATQDSRAKPEGQPSRSANEKRNMN